uniref:Kinesin-like protein n=1 Tax=Albugo laibachii Nc14 TaxID=890382 RepID=F0WS18_9STRA|nr:kinesinlike protein putative [Albugo laibachii Nc14]|eukprot:CCA24136.1 kinesinlike protein putative [Albugo laibachii Nc14]
MALRFTNTRQQVTTTRVTTLPSIRSCNKSSGNKDTIPRHLDPISTSQSHIKTTHREIDLNHTKRTWEGQANVLVTVRLRSRTIQEQNVPENVKVLDHKTVIIMKHKSNSASTSQLPIIHKEANRIRVSHSKKQSKTSILRNRRTCAAPRRLESIPLIEKKRYTFDYVFTPQQSQLDVYMGTTQSLIHGILNGFNATVFAYGCTGAGKTYTMFGSANEPGIITLTLQDLFTCIDRVNKNPAATIVYNVNVSFLEVYNENVCDLLADSGTDFLELREDPGRGSVVVGITEIDVGNVSEVMRLLRRGAKKRSQEITAVNAVSSRSHAVFQLVVEQRSRNVDDADLEAGMLKFGKLSLVDLAGSERAAVTQNRGQRFLEGANINRSLLALGNCINALCNKSALSESNAVIFVPYRGSKLTRLLKDSLGGNCRTVMVANIAPSLANIEETINTLKYANRVKKIKTILTSNDFEDNHTTKDSWSRAESGIIASLREEIKELQRKLAIETINKRKPQWNLTSEDKKKAFFPLSKTEVTRAKLSSVIRKRLECRKCLLEMNQKENNDSSHVQVEWEYWNRLYQQMCAVCLSAQNESLFWLITKFKNNVNWIEIASRIRSFLHSEPNVMEKYEFLRMEIRLGQMECEKMESEMNCRLLQEKWKQKQPNL